MGSAIETFVYLSKFKAKMTEKPTFSKEQIQSGEMEKQVFARNTIVPFQYLKKYMGYNETDIEALIAEATKDIPSKIRNIKTYELEEISLEHTQQETYAFSNIFFINMYDILEKRHLDPELGYKMGLKCNELNPNRGAAIGVAYGGMEFILSRIMDVMQEWNLTKTASFIKKEPGRVVLRLDHKKGIVVNRFAMEYHKGIFEDYANLIDYDGVDITYKKQPHPKREIYDFDIRYKTMSKSRAIWNYLKSKSPLVLKKTYKNLLYDKDLERIRSREMVLSLERIVNEQTEDLKEANKRLKNEMVEKQKAQARLREMEMNEMLLDLMGYFRHSIGQPMIALAGYLRILNNGLADEKDNKRRLYGSIAKLPSEMLRCRDRFDEMLSSSDEGFSNSSERFKSIDKLISSMKDIVVDVLDSAKTQKNHYDPELYGAIEGAARVFDNIQNLLQDIEKIVRKEDLIGMESIPLKNFMTNYIKDFARSPLQNKRPYLLKENNIRFRVDIPEEVRVASKPGILSYIIQNQVQNCIDHAFYKKPKSKKGIINVYAREIDGDRTLIRIRDNGRGIEEKILGNIFSPKITTRKSKLGGLGTTHMRKLVLCHRGGEIRYFSRHCVGTEVRTVLPSKTYNITKG